MYIDVMLSTTCYNHISSFIVCFSRSHHRSGPTDEGRAACSASHHGEVQRHLPTHPLLQLDEQSHSCHPQSLPRYSRRRSIHRGGMLQFNYTSV